MATISKENMIRRQVSERDHEPVACLYGFGEFDNKTPFIELATLNPDSKTKSVSQTIRIPKPELLMLLGMMISQGTLKFADLDDLVSMIKSTDQ